MTKGFWVFWLAVISLVSFSAKGNACTSFCLSDADRPIVGKNYDWSLEDGLVVVNQKGVKRTAAQYGGSEADIPAQWISKYGSITFNQFGLEFPLGGMNEEGLVVEALMLAGSIYPKTDSRNTISAGQWTQFQLDNCGSTNEVINSQSRIRILKPGSAPGMHFFISDKNGHSASVEFLRGKLVVHTDRRMPVQALTNITYAEGVRSWKQHISSKQDGFHYRSRFADTAELIDEYRPEHSSDSIEYAFTVLERVAQGSFTKWQIVHDINARTIYFRTLSNHQIRHINLREIDFSCQSARLVADIDGNHSGNLAGDLRKPTRWERRYLVDNIFKSVLVTADEEFRKKISDGLVAYSDKSICISP